MWKEQVRIKDSRMSRISPQRRPQYAPPERLAILEVKAVRGWSLEQTAKAFLVTSATIASWMKRLDEEGPDALVQLTVPVNKFPDFTRYIVQRLKTLCPTMGKVKIAQDACSCRTASRCHDSRPHAQAETLSSTALRHRF